MIKKRPSFSAYGVELEYMIVQDKTLDVAPVADLLLERFAGKIVGDLSRGALAYSNELALHVIEIKSDEPLNALDTAWQFFQNEVQAINHELKALNAMLLPTAMHPWMNPDLEVKLWPHDCKDIYEAFNRIFDCRGHGWGNLQSAHLNLPFKNDQEFKALHAAIRFLLPLMPALAASSPFCGGKITGFLDTRLETYRTNAKNIPAVTGRVVPEAVDSINGYHSIILNPLYQAIAPHDPQGILQEEWLNARGAIARFDRYTIEVRVLDVQEAPRADFALLMLISNVLQALVAEKWVSIDDLNAVSLDMLVALFNETTSQGGEVLVRDPKVLTAFGLSSPQSVQNIWLHLFDLLWTSKNAPLKDAIQFILQRGSLAQRMLQAAEKKPLKEIYRRLAACLEEGALFDPTNV